MNIPLFLACIIIGPILFGGLILLIGLFASKYLNF